MRNLSYTVPTAKSMDDAVRAVEENAAAYGFRVLHVHDIAAIFAEKGVVREPLKIVEVCNATYAYEALEIDVNAALLLPCPIAVYQQEGQTHISTMKPSAVAGFFPGALEFIADQVEAAVLAIVDDAALQPIAA
jgi:uncharacterized protein (DUF302 family)